MHHTHIRNTVTNHRSVYRHNRSRLTPQWVTEPFCMVRNFPLADHYMPSNIQDWAKHQWSDFLNCKCTYFGNSIMVYSCIGKKGEPMMIPAFLPIRDTYSASYQILGPADSDVAGKYLNHHPSNTYSMHDNPEVVHQTYRTFTKFKTQFCVTILGYLLTVWQLSASCQCRIRNGLKSRIFTHQCKGGDFSNQTETDNLTSNHNQSAIDPQILMHYR